VQLNNIEKIDKLSKQNSWELGCALTFALEAKFKIESENFVSLGREKNLISHDSLRCETPKI
jgi:hypothetical protein